MLSELLGRTVTYRELSFDEDRQSMVRAGVPAAVAEMNAQAFRLTATVGAEWVSGDVRTVLAARDGQVLIADRADPGAPGGWRT